MCSVCVISSDPDDFCIKNHDFSAPGPNCLVWLIEAVPKLKITFFRQLLRVVFFFFFFAAIDRIVLRPHAMSQLDHGMGNLRTKDRRTTHTTGKMTQHSTDTPIRTETMDRHIPAHVHRQATKLIKRAMHLITHATN